MGQNLGKKVQSFEKKTLDDFKKVHIYLKCNIGDLYFFIKFINSEYEVHRELNLNFSFHKNSSNKLKDKNTQILGEAISKCKNLQQLALCLNQNEIGIPGVSSLVDGIADCQNLNKIKLEIGRNNIGYAGTQYIGQALSRCANLEILDINLNSSFVGMGATFLGNTLKNYKKLNILTLILCDNFISDQDAANLGFSLGKCQNLKELYVDLSKNLVQDGAIGLGTGLGNCFQLLNLTIILYNNNISTNGASGFLNGLQNCTKLENLNIGLNSNKIESDGVQNFGSHLLRMPNLKNLYLDLSQKIFEQVAKSHLIIENQNFMQHPTLEQKNYLLRRRYHANLAVKLAIKN
ncbi:hypothetical protein ABPG74_008124 [Tetrahymena malaccensis]